MFDQPNSQDPHTMLNERVKHAFALTDDDIKANRDGQMSTLQVEGLASTQKAQGGWGTVLFVVMIFFGCFLVKGKLTEVKGIRGEAGSTVVVILCSIAVMGLFGLAAAGSLTDDIRNKRVESIQGSVECRSYKHKGEMSYRVSLGRKSFLLDQNLYDAFVDGETYTLYYTPRSEILIAAEHDSGPIPPIEPTPPQRSNPLTTPPAHT